MAVQTAGEEAGIRAIVDLPLAADLKHRLEAWIARQPTPQPTIVEAVQDILQQTLGDRPGLAEFST